MEMQSLIAIIFSLFLEGWEIRGQLHHHNFMTSLFTKDEKSMSIKKKSEIDFYSFLQAKQQGKLENL